MKKIGFLGFLFLFLSIAFSYSIRIGDTVTIEVFGQPDFSRTVTVALDGTIPYPYAGNIKVVGLTTDQVKAVVEQTVRRFIKDPIVTVYISKYAPFYIYLQGAVNRTFDMSYLPNLTLTKLFSHLGFTSSTEIDFTKISIIRGGKSTIYNVLPFFYGEYITADPLLQEGDLIYLPPLTSDKKVQISGAYTLVVPYEPGLTLRTILLKLGPLNKDIAQIENAVLVIDDKLTYVNLEDVIYGKTNYSVKPGATLYIPKRDERYVYVIGYIPNPGIKSFNINEEITLSLAITKAGGISKDSEKWIEKIVTTSPDGKSQEYTKDILTKSGNLKLLSGSTVEVVKYPSFRIYLTGDLQTGIVEFDPEEPRTLAGLLTKIGGIKTDVLKWIESIKLNGKTIELSKLSETRLNNNDVVEIKKYPEFKVYITGDFTTQTQITLEPDEPKTLQQLFIKLGGLKTDQLKWIESIKLNGGSIDKTNLSSYILKDKDVVEIKKYSEFKVYLTGDLQTGIINFEPDEPKTLAGLLTKIGGIKTDTMKWIESIKVNGKVADLAKLSEINLNNNDVIEIKKYPEFKVYITGDFTTQSQVVFEPDEPKTLQQLFVKIGGLKTDQIKWIESVKLNGQKIDLSKLNSYTLKDKDVVEIKSYPEFYVYIQGLSNTKGKIHFDPEEKRTLKTLIAKVGLPNEDIENEGKAIINNSTTVELKDIIYGTKDYELSLGDLVQITYEPFTVQLIGTNIGTIQLSYKEPRTLSYLIKKIGITQPEAIEKVILIRDGKQSEYDISSLIYDKSEIQLNRYDTIVIKQSEINAVYVTGDVAAYVTFGYNEPITMQKILAKIGLNDLRRIEKITSNSTSLDFTKDIPIQKGTILNVQLKKPVFVTAMGYLKNTGRVSFDYYETPDLKTLFAKLGGLIITPESYYTSDKVYIMREGKVVEQYNAVDIFKGIQNATLKDGDFVYVTETQPKQVYVFGKGMPNGLIRFTQSEDLDLRTLIGKLGGIKEGISRKVTIVDGEDVKTITWNEYVNTPLKTNATVLFDIDTENYIYVIDPSGKPNMIYTDRPLTLYEVLTKIGTNKNYRKLELTSGTDKQTIELKDISQARSYNVKSGDIVKILDMPENFAYVLGEVNRPGIITLTENTTLLQAIIQSGYFTTKAVPSSVWLYKGGINGKPIKVNLAAATSGGNIEYNPVLEPGDIVFVPTDMFKTALEWIPIINNLITFYNNVSGVFK